MDKPLNYSYDRAKAYGELLGLKWMGDDFVRAADEEAKTLNFTQEQVDAAMKHHLWQVRYLFNPANLTLKQRIAAAAFFLFGKLPEIKQP